MLPKLPKIVHRVVIGTAAATAATAAVTGILAGTASHLSTQQRVAEQTAACAQAHLPHANELVIVFATGTKANGTPGAAFARRLDAAAAEVRVHPQGTKVLVVGRQKNGTRPEGKEGVDYLVHEDGMDPSVLLHADQSPNTVTNVEEAIPNVRCINPDTVVLDTETYHLPRVETLFAQAQRANDLHYSVVGLPAPDLLSPAAEHAKAEQEARLTLEGRATMALDYLRNAPSTTPDAEVG